MAQTPNDMIAEITDVLARAGINLGTIMAEHYGMQSVVTVSVDDEEGALKILQDRPEWQVICEDALLVKVRDEVGALAKITRRLADGGVKIRSIRFVERYDGHALVALATDQAEQARKTLGDIVVG